MKFGQGAVSGVSERVIDFFFFFHRVWYVEIKAGRISRGVEVFEELLRGCLKVSPFSVKY